MKRFSPSLLLAAAIIAGAAACSDSTGGGQITKPPAALNYVHLAVNVQPCTDSVGAWFHKSTNGSDQELALEFPTSGNPVDCTNGGETEDFIRLKLDRQALAALPNGTPIAKWPGAPLEPNGNPLLAGVGPGAFAERVDAPEMTSEGHPSIVPMRVEPHASVDPNDADPRGLGRSGHRGPA